MSFRHQPNIRPDNEVRIATSASVIDISLAKDDVYALNSFLEKFIAWTDYQITDASLLDGATRASVQDCG
jgi:hypothetical protein